MKIVIAFILMLAACRGNDSKKQDSTGDSTVSATQPDTVAMATQTPDELTAQDSVFEDGSVPISWTNAGFDHPGDFKLFLKTFKAAVMNNDTAAIARVIAYPVKGIKNEREFRSHYGEFFSDKVKNAVTQQRLDRIFRTSDGAMIGTGEVWFTERKGAFYIIAINPK